jgi:putative transposase
MPAGLRRYYGKGHLHFITFSCYRRLPLLKTVRARDIFVKELGKVRDEMGFHLLGYVVMPEHVHLLMSEPPQGNAIDGAAEVEAACGTQTAETPKASERGADAIAICGDRRTAASVLAVAVLRFQCVQPRKEERKTELHARESGDSQTGEPSERLAVEQLGILPRSDRVRSDRRGRVRGESPRPRFKERTWGTLRVVLICECAKASSLGRAKFERRAISYPGPPAIHSDMSKSTVRSGARFFALSTACITKR